MAFDRGDDEAAAEQQKTKLSWREILTKFSALRRTPPAHPGAVGLSSEFGRISNDFDMSTGLWEEVWGGAGGLEGSRVQRGPGRKSGISVGVVRARPKVWGSPGCLGGLGSRGALRVSRGAPRHGPGKFLILKRSLNQQ